ncbi:MAG: ABC transporter ATP-binding protein [Pseudomonadaceae bacterium]|nr:ABC transporter ATP-binding protein [Pseudomonadaceae bacterium]
MLEIRGLSKTYPNGVRALDGVELDIPTGMFGLLGPNGAGKSSLMRTLATLQEPDSGHATFDGVDIADNKDVIRRQLGYLPQEFGAYPRTSPLVMLDHLATMKGFTAKGERRDMVERLLQQTNLYDVRKKSIDTFSGGMRQRFGIAQALIGQPKLVIVDEPTAGLDPAERRRFHNLLASIGEDVVVILSTHIVDDVADLCPRMAILGQGKILEKGRPRDLVTQLDGRIYSATVAREDLARFKLDNKVISTRMVEGQIQARVLAEAGDGLEPTRPELEDVYFATLLKHNIDIALD